MAVNPLKVPTLATPRLTMEPVSMAHSEGMFELWSNAEVCKFSGRMKGYDGNAINMPATHSADSDLVIDFWLKAANDGWGLRWAVLLAARKGEFAGLIGFNSITTCSEIAFHLLPSHWGKGIMTEASEAAIEWRHSEGASEIEAFIEPANTLSISLAHRLGMAATDTFVDGARRYRMSL